MSKHEKLLNRLLTVPADFTFSELATLLNGFGYRPAKTGKATGSAVCFIHDHHKPILFHRPHPGNEVKRYVVRDLIEQLKSEGLL